jgi:hypothetical protein
LERVRGAAHYLAGSIPPRSVVAMFGATRKRTAAGRGRAVAPVAHDAFASASAARDGGLP